MKNKTIKGLCVGLSALMLSSGLLTACKEAEKDVKVAVAAVANTIKFERNTELPETEARLDLSAAKGESEGKQLVLKASASAKLDVKKSDLVSANGTVLSADCTEVYFLKYMDIQTSDIQKGVYPDAMIPFEYIKQAKENKLEKNLAQGLWFTVRVPETQEAGTYTGSYKITVGSKTINVPVTVEVYDFALPETPAMKSIYLIWRGWLMDGELECGSEVYRKYYELLNDYRLDAYDMPAEFLDMDAYISDLRKYYDQISTYCIPYSMKWVKNISYNGTTKSIYTINEEDMQTYLYAIAKASLEDGKDYFSKAYYYIHEIEDESSLPGHTWKQEAILGVEESLNKATEAALDRLWEENLLTTNLENAVRSVKHLNVSFYMEQFEDIFDVWCPLYPDLGGTFEAQSFYEEYAAREDREVFGYWCMNSRNAAHNSFAVEDELISARDKSWRQYVNGVTGDLYWCVNMALDLSESFGSQYGRVEDFYTTNADRDAAKTAHSAGDGYLVYPGRAYGSDSPFPSLRLEAIRDGSEDYDYMSLLESAFFAKAGESGKQAASKLLEFWTETLNTQFMSTFNHDGLQMIRDNMARMIEASANAGYALKTLELTDGTVNAACVLNAGWKLYANGQEVLPVGGVYPVSVERGKALELRLVGEGKTYEFALSTPNAEEEILTFDTQAEIDGLGVRSNALKVLNEDEAFALSGNSAKITLNGNAEADGFTPFIKINVSGVENWEAFSMSLYNASDEDIVFEVLGWTDSGDQISLDTVKLKAGVWTDYRYVFNERNIGKKKKKSITAIMLQTVNILREDGTAGSAAIYLDRFKSRKQ